MLLIKNSNKGWVCWEREGARRRRRRRRREYLLERRRIRRPLSNYGLEGYYGRECLEESMQTPVFIAFFLGCLNENEDVVRCDLWLKCILKSHIPPSTIPLEWKWRCRHIQVKHLLWMKMKMWTHPSQTSSLNENENVVRFDLYLKCILKTHIPPSTIPHLQEALPEIH